MIKLYWAEILNGERNSKGKRWKSGSYQEVFVDGKINDEIIDSSLINSSPKDQNKYNKCWTAWYLYV